MREIKFRAWYKKEEKMCYSDKDADFDVEYWDGVEGSYIGVLNATCKRDKYILMQYTGLKDKNGKEIYEGDIVECEQAQGYGKFKGIVHFGIDYRESSGWCDPRIYLDTRPFNKHNGSEFCIFHIQPEVIGNIYENHELLEEK